LPLPLPLVMVIQLALLVAVQLHPVPAVTVTLPLPPLDVKEALLGESAYVQGAPLSLTVKLRPPMVIVPVCELVLVLAATE
jgi:hypothetical protein